MTVFFINPFLGAVGGDYESIATVTVGSGGASSIEFTSIPGTYQHLQVRGIGRTNRNAARDALALTVNGSSGTNYAGHELFGNGSSTGAYGEADVGRVVTYEFAGATATAELFGAVVLDILDYASTAKNKTFRMFGGLDRNGAGLVNIHSGLWKSTDAITSVKLAVIDATLIAQHSTFALYGVKAP